MPNNLNYVRHCLFIPFAGILLLAFISGFTTYKVPKQFTILSDSYPPPNSQPTVAVTQNSTQNHNIFLPIIINQFPPINSKSYYMWTVTDVFGLGCSTGSDFSSINGSQNLFVFLDYGKPNQNSNGVLGTILYDQTPISIDEIASSAVIFAQGFYYCSTDDLLTVAIGTNSSGGLILDIIALNHGQAWANLVSEVNNRFLDYPGLSSRVAAVGGINIEPGFNPFYIPNHWLNGYNSVANHKPVYVIASADGCPLDYPYTEPETGSYTPAVCNNGWSQEDIYHVSWGSSASWPYPEIYNNATAIQWYRIGLYSKYNHYQMVFKGAMTQLGACNQLRDEYPNEQHCVGTDYDPASGYIALYDQISSDPYHRITNVMIWSTDIFRYKLP